MGSAPSNSIPPQVLSALQQDPVLFQQVFHQSMVGMALSVAGEIIDINDTAIRLSGYSREELIGTSLVQLVAPESRPAVLNAIRTESAATYELTFIRGDGSRYDAEAQATVITYGDRKVRLTLLRDITERRRNAAALRDHQHKLDMALRVARLGHWELDLASMRFTVDDNFLSVLGTSAAEEGGHTISASDYTRRFVPADAIDTLHRELRAIETCSSSSYEHQIEHHFRRADGSAGIMLVHVAALFDDAGRPVRAHGVNQDITDLREAETERQRLQDQLLQNQKLEALGTLAGGIAHDFNNILTGILGNLQLAKLDLDEQHPAHLSVVDAHRAAQRARELVSRILAFGRRSSTQRQPLPLGSIVNEVTQLLRASLPPTISLTTDLQPACPMVDGDPTELHQVLLNLCTNAAQAIPQQQGNIRVELRFAPPDEALLERHPQVQLEHAVHLAIIDDGSGIDPDLLPRIFEPFFTTKRTGEGTGLGLTTVHRIMEHHLGVVTIDSTLGEGTQVTLHFAPSLFSASAKPTGSTSVPPVETPSFGRGRRLLLVDDDQAARTTSQRALDHLGFNTTAISDPLDALALYKERSAEFCAVLTDYAMPRMDGAQLARLFKEINPAVPILLVSGFLHELTRDNAASAGLNGILAKPYDVAELAAALHDLLNP